MTCTSDRDDTALLDHYRNKHSDIYKNWVVAKRPMNGFDLAYTIVFVEAVGENLIHQEEFWFRKLRSTINREKIMHDTIIN